MWSDSQKALVGQARRLLGMASCGPGEDDYRDLLAMISRLPDCRSATDARLTEEHFDHVMRALEFSYWARIDGGEKLTRAKPFLARDYWRGKNSHCGQTSRDRFSARGFNAQLHAAETALQALGKDHSYLRAIEEKTGGGHAYLAALRRTILAAEKQQRTKGPA